MAANVFFVIIPAHWELVRAKQEGREPDPEPGLRAKQRSVHNNYLTLPVVFTMLAGHFPLAFGQRHAWLVLLAIFALVAAIRHFFNLLAHRAARAGGSSARPRWERSRSRWCSLPRTHPRRPCPTPRSRRAIVAAALPDRATRAPRRRSASSSTAWPDGAAREPRSRRWSRRGRCRPGTRQGMTDEEREQLVAWASADG